MGKCVPFRESRSSVPPRPYSCPYCTRLPTKCISFSYFVFVGIDHMINLGCSHHGGSYERRRRQNSKHGGQSAFNITVRVLINVSIYQRPSHVRRARRAHKYGRLIVCAVYCATCLIRAQITVFRMGLLMSGNRISDRYIASRRWGILYALASPPGAFIRHREQRALCCNRWPIRV